MDVRTKELNNENKCHCAFTVHIYDNKCVPPYRKFYERLSITLC